MFVLPLAYPMPRRAFRPGFNGANRCLPEEADAPQRPAMDAAETDTTYTLTFDLPGMGKENVQVTVEGNQVRIEASATQPAPAGEGARVLRRERHVPRFARTVELPVEVDAAASNARFENGVLTLTLVKKQAQGARTIQIQ
jgi:HSP20 family protein